MNDSGNDDIRNQKSTMFVLYMNNGQALEMDPNTHNTSWERACLQVSSKVTVSAATPWLLWAPRETSKEEVNPGEIYTKRYKGYCFGV